MDFDKLYKATGVNPEEYNEHQIEVLLGGLSEGINIKKYANPKFISDEMEVIAEGLMYGVDVDKYAKLEFNSGQMREILEGLIVGINVDLYTNPKLSPNAMCMIRQEEELKKLGLSTSDTENFFNITAAINEELIKMYKLKIYVNDDLHDYYRNLVEKRVEYAINDLKDKSIFTNNQFSLQQKIILLDGISLGIDVTSIAKSDIAEIDMYKKLLELIHEKRIKSKLPKMNISF